MGGINQRGWRITGGILSLACTIRDYDRALEYDLLTRTGRTLNEFIDMGASGMVALISFVQHLTPDSALYQSMNPSDEFGQWYTTTKTNTILADLFDIFVSAHTKKGRKVKEYPRPKKKQGIGKGAIPVSEFWDWWNKG